MLRAMRLLLLGCLLEGLTGCAPEAATALMGVGGGLTASAINRSQGGCYAICPVGTHCVSSTGLCEERPCRGRCDSDEVCEGSPTIGEHCAKKQPVPIQIDKERITPP